MIRSIFTFGFFLFLTFSSFSQVSWIDLSHPVIGSGDEGPASVEFDFNGDPLFFYLNETTYQFYIEKYETSTNTWDTLYQKDLSALSVFITLETKVIGNSIYFAYNGFDGTGFILNLGSVGASNNVNELIIDNNQTSLGWSYEIDFWVKDATDRFYLAGVNGSSNVIVEEYQLNPGMKLGETLGLVSGGYNPQLTARDGDQIMVLGAVEPSNEYRIFEANFSDPLNFSLLGAHTGAPSGVFLGDWIQMNWKNFDEPEYFVNHTFLGEEGTYRSGPAAANGIPLPDLLDVGFDVSSGYDHTFIFGKTMSNEYVLVFDMAPDGTYDTVAKGQNPIIQNIPGSATGLKMRSYGVGQRLLGFMTGVSSQRILRTNHPPTVANFQIEGGLCTNETGVNFVKNITFADIDGDPVSMISVLNSNNLVADNVNFFQAADGSYFLQGIIMGNTGQTTLTITFTDGHVNSQEEFIIEVVDPIQPAFTAAEYDVCANGNLVELNDFIDFTGGVFTIGATSLDDMTVLDPSSIDIVSNPTINTLLYTFKDVNGCQTTATAVLNTFEPPVVALNVTHSACGNPSGMVDAVVSQSNGGYIEYWSTGAQGVPAISSLNPGHYYHNVIDQKGCITTSQGTVFASDITVNETLIDVSCHNGNNGGISLDIIGAAPPFNVFWSNGYSGTTISNLRPGLHEAMITDANGCQVTYSYFLPNPGEFQLDYTSISPTSCSASNGGLLLINATNAVTPISFTWSGGQTTQDISGLSNGLYNLVAIDNNGCQFTKTHRVNSLSSPSVSNSKVTRSICGQESGAIEISLLPATGNQISNIQWSNGMTSESIYSIPGGGYTCIATQTDGCQGFFSWEVGVRPDQRPSICMVTVDTATTTNLIVWEKPETDDIHHYRIYRETALAGVFELIDTIHYTNISVFNDVVASPKSRSWRYRISSVNQCGVESPMSMTHKTMHLVVSDLGNNQVKLAWDNYEGIPFASYDVFRYTTATGWEPWQANLAFNQLPNDTDNIAYTADLDYYIEIDYGFICTATFGSRAQDYNSSRSNKARGSFQPGDGTGDPNNDLEEVNMGDVVLTLYPNPNNGSFTIFIETTGDAESPTQFEVYTMQGALLLSGDLQLGENNLQLKHAQSGMYMVRVWSEKEQRLLRIVKQ